MIVSHKHRFIYLKTIKTASSSMETLLSSLCGPEDIITPAAERFMKHRTGPKAQNYRLDHPAVPKQSLLRRLMRRPIRYYHPEIGHYEHMPAWRVKTYLGEEIWNSYFKFTFERNPWDRQVSFYHYKCKDREGNHSFQSFLRRKKRAYVNNYEIYTINNDVAVDFLGRFEDLEADFEKVKSRLNLDPNLHLPKVNASSNPGKYRTCYTDETREMIGNWYRNEIGLLGYRF